MAGKRAAVLLILAILALAGAGCAPAGPEGEVAPLTTATPGPKMAPVTPPKIPAEAESLVQRAREDLARRLGISPDEIAVVSVEEVLWRDSSLGCPQPGQVYLQVITPGYRIVLRARGQEYGYHADQGRRVIFCTKGRGPEPVATAEGEVLLRPSPTGTTPIVHLEILPESAEAEKAINLAKMDLARRLQISSEDIHVKMVEHQEWPGIGLSCAALPGPRAPRAVTPGFLIILVVKGKAYEYHSDLGQHVLYCPQGPWLKRLRHPRPTPHPSW